MTKKADVKRLEIIQTARKRFIKHGVSKTTLDEIAKDMRLGKATLYHYFESKHSLYIYTLKYESNEYLDCIRNIFNNEELQIVNRFFEYYKLKLKVKSDFPLLYELLHFSLLEFGASDLRDIIFQTVREEEKILQLVLNNIERNLIRPLSKDFSKFILLESYSLIFAKDLLLKTDDLSDQKILEEFIHYLSDNLSSKFTE